MKVTVEVPDNLLEHPQDADREVYRELVLSAYARRRISGGRVGELLDLDFNATERLLAERGLKHPYGEADLAADLAGFEAGRA